MDKKPEKRASHFWGIVTGLLLCLLAAEAQYWGWFEAAELRSYDLRFHLRGSTPPPEDIILVTIDETTRKTLKKSLGQLSRGDYASVVDLLTAGEARLVVLDIDFAANKNGDNVYSEAIACAGNVILSSFIALGEWVTPNDKLANSDNTCRMGRGDLRFPPSVAVGPEGVAVINWEKGSQQSAQAYRVYFSVVPFEYPSDIQQGQGGHVDVDGSETSLELTLDGVEEGETLYIYVEKLAFGGPAGVGAVNIIEDMDDRVRRLPMVVARGADDPVKVAALPLEAAIKASLGDNPVMEHSKAWGVGFSGDGARVDIPLDDGQMLINYIGGRDSFKRISFGDVLEGRYDPEDFQGKIVMVGNTHQLAHDEYPTPFGRQDISARDAEKGGIRAGFTSGLEIHANALNTILKRNFIYPLADVAADKWEGMAGTALFIFLRVRVQWSAVLFITSVSAVSACSYYVFARMNIWAPTVGPLAALIATYGGGLFYHVYVEGREKRWIKDTFGRYLAPSVVEQLTRDPSLVKLGGEELELTAFFSDIQGFTSISEQLGSPSRLVELLNDYLSAMADIIERREGTVDKYEGDAVIAFWGAPVYFPDHALKACLAALDQQEKLAELREKWKDEGKWPEIVYKARARMGINTGPMVVGNMGSRGRMNYTIMGDAVNLASRLEAAGKQYGVFNMISESTYERVRKHVEVRQLDKIRVVGKREPVTVYELLARKGELDDNTTTAMALFAEGLLKYRAMEWDAAVEKFRQTLEIVPEDGPSRTYIDRCKAFRENPPPQDWDGVFELKSK